MRPALTLGSALTSQVKNEIAPDRYDLARSGASRGWPGRRPHIKLNGREFREYHPPGQNARDGSKWPTWPKMVPNRARRVLSRAVQNGHESAAARRAPLATSLGHLGLSERYLAHLSWKSCARNA